MDNDTQVLVEIIQGSNPASACGGWAGCAPATSCGSTTDYAELTEKLAQDLNKDYGNKVQVRYIDIDKVGMKEYPVIDQVIQMGYPYPITLINGEPKFAGGIMQPEIKSILDKLLK